MVLWCHCPKNAQLWTRRYHCCGATPALGNSFPNSERIRRVFRGFKHVSALQRQSNSLNFIHFIRAHAGLSPTPPISKLGSVWKRRRFLGSLKFRWVGCSTCLIPVSKSRRPLMCSLNDHQKSVLKVSTRYCTLLSGSVLCLVINLVRLLKAEHCQV